MRFYVENILNSFTFVSTKMIY